MFKLFSIFSITAVILSTLWRIEQFGHLEMVSDQAFFTQWIMALSNADNFLPRNIGNEGWFASLMHDEDNFLNIFLRQIYQAHLVLFTVVTTSLFVVVSMVIGASMESVMRISVMFSAFALVLLAYFPVLCRPTHLKKFYTIDLYIIGGVSLTAASLSPFLNIFSVMGSHNAGVMFLLLATIVTQRWLSQVSNSEPPFANWQSVLLLFGIQMLANYAHYTNVFIIAPATVIAIALDPSLDLAKRIRIIAKFSIITFITFLPALALIFVYSAKVGGAINDQTFIGNIQTFILSSSTTSGDSVGERVAIWFQHISAAYSAPALIIGVLGTFAMAWRDRIILPSAIVSAHFLAGSLLSIFGQYDRTAVYLIPMLILGGSWLFVTVIRVTIKQRHAEWYKSLSGCVVIIFLIVAFFQHGVAEYSRLSEPTKIWRWGKWVGRVQWQPVISEIEMAIPDGSVIIPENYGLSHQFRAMSTRQGSDFEVMRPLETLMSNWKAGELQLYINTRGLNLSRQQPIFVFSSGKRLSDNLNQELSQVFGNDGFKISGVPEVKTIQSWNTQANQKDKPHLTLYEVSWR